MTQVICEITTDEVNVDVVVEPQADTIVEVEPQADAMVGVANRAGGMEQVFHDNTLIGNGNSIDLGVNTDLIATKEYVDEKVALSIDTYTKDQIDGKLTAVEAQIDANADAIQKTREDYIEADSEIHQILNSHAGELTTLRNDVDDLGDQVAEIESKIPESASSTNQLATKADLATGLDDYVKKSGDTMTGLLTIQSEEDYDLSTPPVGGLSFKSNASPVEFTNRMRQVGNGFIAIEYLLNGKQYSNLVFGDQEIYIDNTENGTGNPVSLGTSGNPWDNVYAKKLNNGADVAIPTEGGTLARIEDLDAREQEIRDDVNQVDSELQSQITAHAEAITTNKNDIDELGDQVSAIEEKIPETASAENPLVTRSEISSVYKFKGSVATYNDLPTGATVGDVYNVTDTGANYAWDGSAWDKLSETVDLSSYATTAYVNAREQDIRNDYMQADSDLQTQINGQATAITGNTDGITAINAKIPATTSADNMLVNNQQMSDMEMNLRDDIDTADSELQTQITAQAAAIAGKQDELIAGDNIIISNNVISATGADGGAGFDIVVVQELPETGQKGIIYLLAKDGAAPDVYDEYVWITATQTFELIGSTKVDLTDYAKKEDLSDFLPLSGGTVQGVVKIQNGQGTGSLWVGADVNNTTLTNNRRHLARIVVPSFTNTERGATLLGWDSSGDTNVHITNNSADMVGFGGSKKITNATSPMGISFCVAKTRESTAAADKVYPLAMDANAANFDVPVSAPDLTVGTAEGTINIGVVAGTATIATNNGLDIVAQTKFDTAPTTDDNTTYANALDTSLVRKAQVATAIADAMANVGALPDQTGNAGKFLMTDGTTVSWGEALVNKAEKSSTLFVSDSTQGMTSTWSVVLGRLSYCNANGAVVIGFGSDVFGIGGIAIGRDASAASGAVAIGQHAKASAQNAIQLGGVFGQQTNSDANTFKVSNANGNFEMMSADGTIPADRMSATAGTTGQVLTKTDTGMAWADASGGDGDIDCGVMS